MCLKSGNCAGFRMKFAGGISFGSLKARVGGPATTGSRRQKQNSAKEALRSEEGTRRSQTAAGATATAWGFPSFSRIRTSGAWLPTLLASFELVENCIDAFVSLFYLFVFEIRFASPVFREPLGIEQRAADTSFSFLPYQRG